MLNIGGFVNRWIEVACFAATLAIPFSASAQAPWNGMSIYQFCMGDTVLFDGSTCRAYIQGVTDTYETINPDSSRSICIPKDKVKRKKGEALVIEWLDFFKERKTEKPFILISDALEAIFPCKKSKTKIKP